jgi:hypothetical protein
MFKDLKIKELVLLYKWLNKQTKALLVVSFAKLTFVFRELNE